MPRDVGIAAGQRDKLVQIETATDVTRSSGLPGQNWVALGTPIYMSRRDVSADERLMSDQQSAWGRVSWQMPYQTSMDPETVDVTKSRRLNYNGRIFDIEAAFLLERRIGIELVTLAKVG